MPTLEGVVERITFHNEETGYTVAKLARDDTNHEVAVVGNMLGVSVGEHVRLEGEWAVHGQYGRQFKVERYTTVLPATAAGIQKYLGSGLVKGIGPKMAERIVLAFGAETLNVIEDQPERLYNVEGVGPKRVLMIKAAWQEQRQIREVMVFLQSHGVSPALAVRIYKQYGDGAAAVVKTDPYRLARDVYGIGFITADRIARNMGIAADAPERVAAGMAYTLSQKADEGHVYVPQTELTEAGAKLLDVPSDLVTQGIETLRQEEQIQVEHGAADPSKNQPAEPRVLLDAVLPRGGQRRRQAAAVDGCFARPALHISQLRLAAGIRCRAATDQPGADAQATRRGAHGADKASYRHHRRPGYGQDDLPTHADPSA